MMKEIIINNWFKSLENRDFETIESLYTNDSIIHTLEGPVRGGKAMIKIINQWLDAFPDIILTPTHVLEEKDGSIIVFWCAEGTFKKPMRNIAPTGKPLHFHGHTTFYHKNGKIIEHSANPDYLALSRASRMLHA